MYTQCPLCDTQYQISAAELKVALGKVRCAQCQSVFNALSHLTDTLPEIPTLTENMPAGAAEIETPTAADRVPPLMQPREHAANAEDYGHPVLDEDYPLPEADDLPYDPDAWDTETNERTGAAPVIAPTAHARHTNPALPDAIGATARLMADEFAYPRQKPYRFMGTALWSLGILLLLGLLLGQYVYAMRDELARKPELRPLLEQLCAVVQPFTHCEIPLRRDVALIALEGQELRQHPRLHNTLLASLTLLNKASFVQPYPVIELTLTDFNGALVGQRRFAPAEYLLPDVDATRGMPPQGAAAVTLELVTPSAPVNLELTSWSLALF